MALDMLDHAQGNGVHLEWVLADIWYSEKPAFLVGLEQRNYRYVVEIPRNLQGWLYDPCRGPEQTPRYPARAVEHLCRHAKQMTRQEWIPFHIKNTDKGPMVWNVKSAPFWLRRGDQVLSGYHFIWATDPLNPSEEKIFLVFDPLQDTLTTWLHVGFARWPVERVTQDKKSELGFSHFEVRKHQALIRHFTITMISNLFLARQTERLRGEKSVDHDQPSSRSHKRSPSFVLA